MTPRPLPAHVEVAVVGAGFGGIAAVHALRERGVTDVAVLERGDDVGGTWRDNDYPGAACDVPSQLYSLSFAPNPEWSHSFSRQGQIQAYLRGVARDLGMDEVLHTGTELTGARWDDDRSLWEVDTSRGRLTARFLLSAAGALSDPSVPEIPGLDRFGGPVWHSAQWRHDVDLTGKRVAVVGTGASAIQFVPQVAKRAREVVLLQRTPAWIVPRTDRRLTDAEKRAFRRWPVLQKAVRAAIYGARELYVLGFAVDPRFMAAPRAIARAHLERQVRDPELRRRLTPDYEIGCKRILISNDFYPALAKPHVELVSSGLASVDETGVTAVDGTRREVDVIVFGTGFRVTDLPIAHRLRGRDGRTLARTWAERGMSAYKGAAVHGFPNLLLLVGPNTGLGHSSQVYMIETQAGYAAQAVSYASARCADTLEVREPAQQEWDARVQQRMSRTVWATGGCRSWYLDAQGRNTTLWPGATWEFRAALRSFDPAAYRVERRYDLPDASPSRSGQGSSRRLTTTRRRVARVTAT